MEKKRIKIIGKKKDWVAKDEKGKIFFVDSDVSLEEGWNVEIEVYREKQRYGFGKVAWRLNNGLLISGLTMIPVTEEIVGQMKDSKLKEKVMEVLGKEKEEKKEWEEIDRELQELKQNIERKEYTLSDSEVEKIVSVDTAPVWYKDREDRDCEGYKYISLRGRKVEEVEEEIAEELFKEGYARLSEKFGEDRDIESGRKLVEIWRRIVEEYILERQIYTDENGKRWEFEKLAKEVS